MGQTRKPEAGDIYRHFKDKLYEIITVAIHSETEEEMVVYRQMYGNLDTYVRLIRHAADGRWLAKSCW